MADPVKTIMARLGVGAPAGNPTSAATIDPNSGKRAEVVNQVDAETANFLQLASESGVDPVAFSTAMEKWKSTGDDSEARQLFAAAQTKDLAPDSTTLRAREVTPLAVSTEAIKSIDPNGALTNPVAQAAPAKDEPKTVGPVTQRIKQSVAEVNDASPFLNPFKVAGEMANRAGNVEQGIQDVVAQTNKFGEKLNEIQTSRRARTEKNIGQLDAINEEQQGSNNALKERLNPFLQAKQKIDTRLAELATNSGGLLGEIRGLFDSNWNYEDLMAKSDKLQRGINGIIAAYSAESANREAIFNAIVQDDKLGDELDSLAFSEQDETMKFLTGKLLAAREGFNFLGDMVNQNSELLRAQLAARAEKISSMDIGQLSKYESAASKAGGMIEVDGIPMYATQLRAQRQSLEAIERNEKASKLALAAQQLNLSQEYDQNTLSKMTPEALIKVRDSGYKLNGRPVPPMMVNGLIAQGIQARDASFMATAGQAGALPNAQATANSLATFMSGVSRGLRSTEGEAGGKALIPLFSEVAMASQQMAADIRKAKATGDEGQVNAVANAWNARLQDLYKRTNQSIDGAALQLARGDKTLGEYYARYFRGQSFTPNEAAGFAAYFSEHKENLPPQIRYSDHSRMLIDTYDKARASVDESMKQAGQTKKSLGAGKYDQMVKEVFSKNASKTITNVGYSAIWSKLPDLARGGKHVFGGISQKTWQNALANGDREAAKTLAGFIGVDEKTAWSIMQGGGTPEQRKQAQPYAKQINIATYGGIFNALDSSPEAGNMRGRPSEALIDWLSSSTFKDKVQAYETISAKQSIGGAAAMAFTQGKLQDRFNQLPGALAIANGQRVVAQTAGGFAGSTRYGIDGAYKMQSVLAAIPGINGAEEKALLNALTDVAKNDASSFRTGDAVSNRQLSQGYRANLNYGALERLMTSHKFDDPNLERIRKLVAPKIRDYGESMDRAVASLANEGE